MKILLVAATKEEIGPFIDFYKTHSGNTHSVDILITGVGMVATAFSMGTRLQRESYDLALNAGIAGAFDRSLNIGEVVNIVHDTFSELGAEDGTGFLSIEQLGFGSAVTIPVLPSGSVQKLSASLRQVPAITVNCVHGKEESINLIRDRLFPQTESMEGAAFFYACSAASLPCLQLRSVSNYVERRNRDGWNIPLAVRSLNEYLINFYNTLE